MPRQHRPHVCVPIAEVADQEHRDYLASLSPQDYEAIMGHAIPLANAFYRVINEQDDVPFGALIEAVVLVRARLEVEMRGIDPAKPFA